ncbi:MAG: TIGR02391 family protein [Phormidesmis sp.]
MQHYQDAYDKALELFDMFDDAESDELLRLYALLENDIERLMNVSGLTWQQCGNLGRHLSFMRRYLEKSDENACSSDIHDIIFSDLPTGLRSLLQMSATESHFDPALNDAVLPLIQGEHYDSAIRKAFVVLTDRLRRGFGVSDNVDGEELVNFIFGKKVSLQIDDAKKKSYRNLISGFYGVYRNKYAHNDVAPTLAEAKAILEMVNNIISEIEEITDGATDK